MKDCYVNNHIHTTYSFSPYTPKTAVAAARAAGLTTCGLMDHDSIGGAHEFIRAGRELGMPVTVGLETRVTLKGTFLETRRMNNPDQNGVAYVAIHGVPHQNIDYINGYFEKYRVERNKRNKAMSEKLAAVFKPFGIDFTFDEAKRYALIKQGGTMTERTLCWAAALKIIDKFGKGEQIAKFLKEDLGINAGDKIAAYLADKDNTHYEYDLLGALKSGLVGRFYIDADRECMPVDGFIAFTKKVGAISAYAYLGDVGNSATGDKKAQTFEDGYLPELFGYLKDAGFNAVTYMPSRNTLEQLARVRALCAQYGFFEISGEDINSSRQSFICAALERPEFAHLITSTWALIGHENAATENIENGMFSEKTIKEMPYLKERINYFAASGKKFSI